MTRQRGFWDNIKEGFVVLSYFFFFLPLDSVSNRGSIEWKKGDRFFLSLQYRTSISNERVNLLYHVLYRLFLFFSRCSIYLTNAPIIEGFKCCRSISYAVYVYCWLSLTAAISIRFIYFLWSYQPITYLLQCCKLMEIILLIVILL